MAAKFYCSKANRTKDVIVNINGRRMIAEDTHHKEPIAEHNIA